MNTHKTNFARNCVVTDVPTGKIIVLPQLGTGSFIECLSLADFGQDSNVKADFLGLQSPDFKRNLMPLEDKWVVTISTQSYCSMGCAFCDVPNANLKHSLPNLSVVDLANQVNAALSLYPDVKTTKRLNIHFARMGEPGMNMDNVVAFADNIRRIIPRVKDWPIHMVVSTVVPKVYKAQPLIMWGEYIYQNGGGLQLSINSTSDAWREHHMPGASSLREISTYMESVRRNPQNRKFTLNFAVTKTTIIDADKLKSLFDPANFMVKLTPLHKTSAATRNGLQEDDNYGALEEELKAAGFDVLVFYSSEEEESGIITCGNALVGGSNITAKHSTYLWRY